jgi:hypothetical protein
MVDIRDEEDRADGSVMRVHAVGGGAQKYERLSEATIENVHGDRHEWVTYDVAYQNGSFEVQYC